MINTKENTLVQFIKNFSVLFGCRSIGIVICLFTSILNGRTLTVEEMGQFNLIVSLSNVLVIPIVFGVNTSLLKILPETSVAKRKKMVGTVFTCNMLLCLGLVVVGWLGVPIVCHLLKITEYSWWLAITFAIVCNGCIVIETFLKTEEKFFCIGIAKVTGSLFLLGAYGVSLFYLHKANFYLFIIFNILSQVVILLITFLKLGHYKVVWDKEVASTIYKISFVYMLSWLLSTSLYHMDLYILSYFTNAYDVGIYSVYQVNIRNYFSIFYHDIFAAVFLPTIINRKVSKQWLYKQVFKWLPLIFLVLGLGTSVVVILLILAYGNQYAIVPIYVFFIAMGISFQGIYFLLNSLLVIDGMEGAKLALDVLAKPYLFLILIIIILTKYFGIIGTFISFMINQSILMGMITWKCKETLRK